MPICCRSLFTLVAALTWAVHGAPPAHAQDGSTQAVPLHHRAGGFQNNCLEFAPRGRADFVRWRWHAVRNGLRLAQLPRIDLVVISHNHYDHCDAPTLQALNAQTGGPPLFLVPLGLKAWAAELGISNVVEMDWWQTHHIDSVDVVMTPVQHWSGRSLTDRLHTLWGGWALFAPDAHLFFAGDTGYSPDFADIAKRFASRQADFGGFDIALIPIGAYAPRWFMKDQHVDSDEAVRIHRDLRAKRSLGIHWGTSELTDEPLDEPPRALAQALARAGVSDDDFFLLALGQTRKLPRRGAAP